MNTVTTAKQTRILCLSDTHGQLPELDLAEIDLVLHAGDFSPLVDKNDLTGQLAYFENVFCPWVRRLNTKVDFFFTWGNHEVFAERLGITECYNDVTLQHLLHDTFKYTDNGLLVYGTAWTTRFCNWAFNAEDTEEELGRHFSRIPDEVDILLTHGPPYGILDEVEAVYAEIEQTENLGSEQLLKRVEQLKELQLVLYGHIHYSYGEKNVNGTHFINASLMDDNYRVVNKPILVQIPFN